MSRGLPRPVGLGGATFTLSRWHGLIDHPEDRENDALDRLPEALAGWIGDVSGYVKNQHIEEPRGHHAMRAAPR
ncbi:MAG TPA: hypothetical protein VFZ64_08895 [Nocardioidaceae bacterium]